MQNKKSKIIIEYLKKFNLFVSKVMNAVLLSVVYFVGIGLTSVIGKLFRKRFLYMDFKGRETYWTETEEREKTAEDYSRMF